MAVDALILLDNHIQAGETLGAGGLTVTSTAPGYNKDSFRDPNLFTGWKPTDSSADEYAQIETNAAMSTSLVQYVAVAWDARAMTDSKRQFMEVLGATSGGGAYTSLLISNMNNALSPKKISVSILRFTPGSAWKFFRFRATYNSGAGGTQQSPIFLFGCVVCGLNNCIDYQSDAVNAMGQGSFAYISNSGSLRTASGAYLANRVAMPQHDIDFNSQPANESQYGKFFAGMQRYGDNTRAIFARLDGMKAFHSAITGDGVVRLNTDRWPADRYYADAYETSIPFVTEPHSLP